jgi:hypothetical protein
MKIFEGYIRLLYTSESRLRKILNQLAIQMTLSKAAIISEQRAWNIEIRL